MNSSLLPVAYEDRLRADRRWGLDEGGLHLEGKSLVQQTMRRLAHKLTDAGIPYAVVGDPRKARTFFEHVGRGPGDEDLVDEMLARLAER